jgi:protein tyrosine phosphatase (PTP) superfamily phosphohydrolase (DUF442 family)
VKGEAPAPAADDLDLTSGSNSGSPSSTSASVGPGLKRFVAVDLKLAGGSAPSTEGLKWLVEKGYRTVLDLRETSEVPPSFIGEVTGLGLRYVALPMSLKNIDRTRVERFNFEIAAGEARPLFFFDADGARAGALWYIRRIANDRVDDQTARREAQSLGLTDKDSWAAAANYVDSLNAPRTSDHAQTGENESATPGSVSMGNSQSAGASAGDVESSRTIPGEEAQESIQSTAIPAAGAKAATDSMTSTAPDLTIAWRPFAAMVLSGLAVPLAYWSRTLTPIVLCRARASLPGPGHRSKSLPGELGA